MSKDGRALGALKRGVAERAAKLIKADPDRAALAVELGLIDREWLADPGERTISSAAPMEVVQRFLERSVEREPSVIGQMGLNALSLMTYADEAAGEPQTVTICFTDLEGFTSYTDTEGNAAALELLEHHQKRLGPIIRGRGGRVVKRLGDGLLISFEAPEAAVLAAIEMQEAVTDPLRLRVGVHHGVAVATPGDLLGHDVNIAARVTDAARGGEVLVTADLLDSIADRDALPISIGETQHHEFKGVTGPIAVARVEKP